MPKKNLLEWGVFIVSTILVAAVVGYLVYEAVAVEAAPPLIRVHFGESQRTSHGYALRVEVANDGGETASGVRLVITRRDDSGDQESATAEIPFLPRGSSRTASVLFRGDPRTGHLGVESITYEHP